MRARTGFHGDRCDWCDSLALGDPVEAASGRRAPGTGPMEAPTKRNCALVGTTGLEAWGYHVTTLLITVTGVWALENGLLGLPIAGAVIAWPCSGAARSRPFFFCLALAFGRPCASEQQGDGRWDRGVAAGCLTCKQGTWVRVPSPALIFMCLRYGTGIPVRSLGKKKISPAAGIDLLFARRALYHLR